MSGQHTPGPWGDGIHHRTRSGGREVAHVHARGRTPPDIVPIAAVPLGVEGYGFEEGCANARLIAAAPDLLSAVEELLAAFSDEKEQRMRLPLPSVPEYERCEEALAIARGAIAKARGPKP